MPLGVMDGAELVLTELMEYAIVTILIRDVQLQ